MKNITLIAAAAAFAVTLLTGCVVSDPGPAEPADEPEVSAPAPDTLDTSMSPEQAAAIGVDPVFADEAVWTAALDSAQHYCDLADIAPDQAASMSLVQAQDAGVTGTQLGVIWGIAVNLYCPEHAGTVPQ
jgi:hypothetical protein